MVSSEVVGLFVYFTVHASLKKCGYGPDQTPPLVVLSLGLTREPSLFSARGAGAGSDSPSMYSVQRDAPASSWLSKAHR